MRFDNMIITLDKLNDPEKITRYTIKNNSGLVLAGGYYIFFLGFRLGFHLDSKTCRLAIKSQ
jgi:hypothetical protein